jgi:hypothetical protein
MTLCSIEGKARRGILEEIKTLSEENDERVEKDKKDVRVTRA